MKLFRSVVSASILASVALSLLVTDCYSLSKANSSDLIIENFHEPVAVSDIASDLKYTELDIQVPDAEAQAFLFDLYDLLEKDFDHGFRPKGVVDSCVLFSYFNLYNSLFRCRS